MPNAPYADLIDGFVATISEAVANRDFETAEKFCFTILCEEHRLEHTGSREEKNIIVDALDGISGHAHLNEVLKKATPKFERQAKQYKLAA